MYMCVHVPANKSSPIKGDLIHLSNVITGDHKDIQVATRGVNSEGFWSNWQDKRRIWEEAIDGMNFDLIAWHPEH